MAAWEIGEVQFQRRLDAGWTYADGTVTAGSFYTFRGHFTVVNGTGPINLGHLEVERLVGAAWEIWPGTFARDVEPGHSDPFPPTIGDFVVWEGKIFLTEGTHTLRMRLDWDGGPYYSSVILPNQAPMVLTAEVSSRRATSVGRPLDVTSRGRSRTSVGVGRPREVLAAGAARDAGAERRILAATASGSVRVADAERATREAIAGGRVLSVVSVGTAHEALAAGESRVASAVGRTLTATASR